MTFREPALWNLGPIRLHLQFASVPSDNPYMKETSRGVSAFFSIALAVFFDIIQPPLVTLFLTNGEGKISERCYSRGYLRSFRYVFGSDNLEVNQNLLKGFFHEAGRCLDRHISGHLDIIHHNLFFLGIHRMLP
jgi:hypothetical protein